MDGVFLITLNISSVIFWGVKPQGLETKGQFQILILRKHFLIKSPSLSSTRVVPFLMFGWLLVFFLTSHMYLWSLFAARKCSNQWQLSWCSGRAGWLMTGCVALTAQNIPSLVLDRKLSSHVLADGGPIHTTHLFNTVFSLSFFFFLRGVPLYAKQCASYCIFGKEKRFILVKTLWRGTFLL